MLTILLRNVSCVLIQQIPEFFAELQKIIFQTLLKLFQKNQALVLRPVVLHANKRHNEDMVDVLQILKRDVVEAVYNVLHHIPVFILYFLQNVKRLLFFQLDVERLDNLHVFHHHSTLQSLNFVAHLGYLAQVDAPFVCDALDVVETGKVLVLIAHAILHHFIHNRVLV